MKDWSSSTNKGKFQKSWSSFCGEKWLLWNKNKNFCFKSSSLGPSKSYSYEKHNLFQLYNIKTYWYERHMDGLKKRQTFSYNNNSVGWMLMNKRHIDMKDKFFSCTMIYVALLFVVYQCLVCWWCMWGKLCSVLQFKKQEKNIDDWVCECLKGLIFIVTRFPMGCYRWPLHCE